MNGLSTSQYYGKAKNNSLQVIFQRRLSKGFEPQRHLYLLRRRELDLDHQ